MAQRRLIWRVMHQTAVYIPLDKPLEAGDKPGYDTPRAPTRLYRNMQDGRVCVPSKDLLDRANRVSPHADGNE